MWGADAGAALARQALNETPESGETVGEGGKP